MGTPVTRTAVVATALAVALAGCGSKDAATADMAPRQNAAARSTSDEGPGGERERITATGIAAVVLRHLGRDTVRQFVTYEQEPGAVSVMVRLHDTTPHNFAVEVFAPDQADGLGMHECPDRDERGGTFRCRVLRDGTVLSTIEDPHGFSDDNADGMVLSGSAVTAEDGGVLALYESYDDSPAISAAQLEEMVSDPRLSWLTDPAVNEAGARIDIRKIDG